MPRPADKPESNSTLPHHDLNPLVNPLLAQNMGRWAEVYFTSPPEKREEAVLNLLRELGQTASGTPSNLQIQPRQTPQSETLEEHHPQNLTPAPQPEKARQEFVDCRSCGTENPADQKFCGQCGSLLPDQSPVEVDSAARNWSPQALNHEASFSSEEPAPRQSSYEGEYYPDTKTSIEAGTEFDTTMAYDNPRELTWQRDVDGPKLMPEYEPVPYRYRIYVGAALALVIAALLYIGWRGTQASSGNLHTLPQAAPSQATRPLAPSQASLPPAAASSAKEASHADKTREAAPPDNQTAVPNPTHATTRMAAPTRTTKVAPPASASTMSAQRPATVQHAAVQDPAVQNNGTRELAIAEGYLQGAQGKTRDSAEAAKWLWQAVRKENSAAALLLSELYLRGDGVPKSCDQGRLLLSAAGRKGAPGASERIRNLRAFGCQ